MTNFDSSDTECESRAESSILSVPVVDTSDVDVDGKRLQSLRLTSHWQLLQVRLGMDYSLVYRVGIDIPGAQLN